jgi:predicted RNase H-like nuclease (RuvC/YqgF family)
MMPSHDDKLTDIPQMIPERDELDAYRRQRPEAPEARKPPKPPKAAATESAAAGVSSGWRFLAIAGLVFGLAATGAAVALFQQATALTAALEQSNLRISDLEGRLSSTGDSMSQSSASMQVKLKELGAEVDKLWASAWRKNGERIDGLDASLQKASDAAGSDRKQIAALAAAQQKLEQQVTSSQDLAGAIKTLQEQQANLQSAIGRLNSTMNSLASTQSAQEARLKDSEQWQQSNIEFRKQVTQRLTRLENPPSALPQ